MNDIFYLASAPPHDPVTDLNAIACMLSTTLAEAGLMVRFPAPAIWQQANRIQPLEDLKSELQKLGVNTVVVSGETLFSIPDPIPASVVSLEDTLLKIGEGKNALAFHLHSPLLFLEQQPRPFGAEYRRFKEKERSRRDKKTRRELNESHAFMAENYTAGEGGADGKHTLQWIFTQKDGSTILRSVIQPASIHFGFLKAAMAVHFSENVRIFTALLQEKSNQLRHQSGLVGIPVRYPLIGNPSFIQILNQRGIEKSVFTPDVLMERLSTAVWLKQQEKLEI